MPCGFCCSDARDIDKGPPQRKKNNQIVNQIKLDAHFTEKILPAIKQITKQCEENPQRVGILMDNFLEQNKHCIHEEKLGKRIQSLIFQKLNAERQERSLVKDMTQIVLKMKDSIYHPRLQINLESLSADLLKNKYDEIYSATSEFIIEINVLHREFKTLTRVQNDIRELKCLLEKHDIQILDQSRKEMSQSSNYDSGSQPVEEMISTNDRVAKTLKQFIDQHCAPKQSDQLKQSIAHLGKEMQESMQEQNKRHIKDIENLESRLKVEILRSKKLQEYFDSANRTIKDLRKETSPSRSLDKDLQFSLNKCRQELDEKNLLINSLGKDISEKQAKIEEQEKAISKASQKIAQLEVDASQLRSQSISSQSKNLATASNIEEKQAEEKLILEAMSARIKQRQQKIVSNEKDLKQREEKLFEMQQKQQEANLELIAREQSYKLQEIAFNQRKQTEMKRIEQLEKISEKEKNILNQAQRRLQEQLTEFSLQKQRFQNPLKNLDFVTVRKSFYESKSFLNGKILTNFLEEKKYLLAALKGFAKAEIKSTELLFQMSDVNKFNFHKVIDNVRGLLFLARTDHVLVAGFYEGVFSNGLMKDEGIIMSLTDRKTYKMNIDSYYPQRKEDPNYRRENIRAVTYDDFYIIFGNAELRVKSCQKIIYSNFGISQSFYNSQGDTIINFFKEGNNRTVALSAMEFYQVSFEE